MKNTFLKKAVATALAAVMAVTFAPVASLNAFAAESGVTAGDVISSDATVEATDLSSRTFTVVNTRTDAAAKITLKVDDLVGADRTKAKTYTFDVTKAANTEFDIEAPTADTKVTIKITGKAYALNGTVSIPTVDFSLTGSNTTKYGLSLSGDLHIADKDKFDDDTKGGARLRSAIGTQPFASVGDEFFLGNDAINAWQKVNSDPVAIVAYNGKVAVDGLKAGSTAVVAPVVYTYGTAISATAAAKTALATVATTLHYSTYFVDAGEASVKMSRQYTENAFYAGYDAIKTGVKDTAVPYAGYYYSVTDADRNTIETATLKLPTGNTVRTSAAVVGGWVKDKGYTFVSDAKPVKLIKPNSREQLWTPLKNNAYFDGYKEWATNADTWYAQAITIDQNGEDWTGKTIDNYVPDLDNDRNNGLINGLTYYTMDPTSFTASEDGIALVDGNKYIVSGFETSRELTHAVQTAPAAVRAAKSVKILQGTEIDPTKGNDLGYEIFGTEANLDVTAPADMSIVKSTENRVVGRQDWVTYTWRVFGDLRNSDRGDKAAVYTYPYKDSKRQDNRTTENVNVAQVASGATLTIYVDPRVGLSKADKYGYFTSDEVPAQLGGDIVGSDWKAATFGEAALVTKKFESAVAGKKDAEYYASKEIKTTVKGVDPAVKITGEINADIVDTVNGTNTWDVNTNAAKAKSQITAHRMYSGREHVYTADPNEIKMLVEAGWKDEGVAFTVNAVASGKGTPIYRVYNKNNGGMHFYTASAAEKDMLLANGWIEGKPVFYGADKATGIPVYRTYNTGSNNGEHNYTTNIAESEMNVQKGWRAEGVAFYVFK